MKNIIIYVVEYVVKSEVKVKICNKCKKDFIKTPKESYKQFNDRKYCSNKCSPR